MPRILVEGHREETLFKVKRALERSGLTESQALDAITAMQAEDILFRELLWEDTHGGTA